ncbi:Calcium/proton exchanger [Atractiella rhizophila]|nr:Calcium/proton exchanger [Atractiella rhizophila]
MASFIFRPFQKTYARLKKRSGTLVSGPQLSTTSVPAPIQAQTVQDGKTAISTFFSPAHKIGPSPGWKTSLKNTIRYSYLNVLLVFIPVSWALALSHQSATVVFFTSFAAIVPLATLLGLATEECALRMGPAVGGLLNATLGNSVEFIVAVLALIKGELRVVQASMVGSILSNALLVLGMCFFAGGLRFYEQTYTVRVQQLNISLLGLSVFSFLLPAVYFAALTNRGLADPVIDQQTAQNEEKEANEDILKISRGLAFILLFVYGAYLAFQFWTHAYKSDNDVEANREIEQDEGVVENPRMNYKAAIALILFVTVLVGVTAEWLVESIDGMTESGTISKEFTALILLPLVGNAAEHLTAVTVSVKNKLDLSLSVAIGSSIQIALFVLPLLVLIAWAIGQPLTFHFDIYETAVLLISILLVNFAIQDGRTNWLEGLCLMTAYGVIALSFWFFPSPEEGQTSYESF